MKKTSLILLSMFLIFTLASCGNKCEHTYDNACDVTCNECGETREVGAHDYNAADCDTPKNCNTCGATDGKALGHTPNEDDGDCMTAIFCKVCGEVTTAGNASHTPGKDDGNCKTEIKCTVCGKTAVAGTADHNDANHDFVCDNPGCQVTVNGAPKDENEGIDLPLVPNN